ncbi:eCIS core domain-containing protein [Roseateles sp. DB2]|uniref:eCIS core domain-containing protein n=1 Tax=Roseateles sp. DB2 TaxID=3453717 RepID=UPI003EEC22E8
MSSAPIHVQRTVTAEAERSAASSCDGGPARGDAGSPPSWQQSPRQLQQGALLAQLRSASTPAAETQAVHSASGDSTRGGLPEGLRRGIESLSGIDMSGVRVHRNSSKPAALQAHAFAQGQDIHLGPGQETHLPHEAWHVVQQAQGRVRPTVQMKGGVPVNDDSGLEREADVMGARALQMKVMPDGGPHAAGSTEGWSGGPVRQLRTYKALSDTQQTQIDAVADDISRMKGESFEDRLGQVASAHGTANAVGNAILGHLAVANPAHALAINAQLGQAAPAKAAFIAAGVNTPDGANVAAARTEQWAQSNAPGGHATEPVVQGGTVREDTHYATQARAAKVNVRGGGSSPASHIFSAAAAAAANVADAKVLAFCLLAPPRAHSFHEVMLAAQDAGLPYVPGPNGYRQIAPLTQADLGLHFPDFFRSPKMLIQLAHWFFNDNAAERLAAQPHFPADVLAHMQAIEPNFRRAHSDGALAPGLAAGLARNLLDGIPGPELTTLSNFITANTVNGIASWALMQLDPAYLAVRNAAGARIAELVFGHLFHAAHPLAVGTPSFLSRAQDSVSERPAGPHVNVFTAGEQQATVLTTQHNVATYGNHDRGVDMDATRMGILNSGITHDEATAIHEYTGNGFGGWHALMGASNTTPQQQLALLVTDMARTRSVDAAHAAKGGLQRLPVYGGPAFRGTNGHPFQTVANRDAALQIFSVGNVVNSEVQLGGGFLSAAKKVGDSFIQAQDYAFVIDGIKTGHDIQLLSQHGNEREILFEPAARFVVTRVEDRLTPTPVGPPNPAHAYNGGNLWIYLHEIGSQKSAPERAARDHDFTTAYEREREGRRLVDKPMYDAAEMAFDNETAPLKDPANRFANNWATAGQVAQSEIFDDWSQADQHMRGRLGHALTLADFTTMHGFAGAHLTVHAGLLRGAGQDVLASGGLDQHGAIAPGQHFSALSDAEFDEYSRNPAVRLLHAHDIGLPIPPHLAGKTMLAQIHYTPGAEVAAGMQSFLTWYTPKFTSIAAIGDANRRRDQAIKFAANAQKKFVSLHPFHDGNGRMSRLVMDHALGSFQIAPALLADTNADTTTPDAQWETAVDQGVQATETLHRDYMG